MDLAKTWWFVGLLVVVVGSSCSPGEVTDGDADVDSDADIDLEIDVDVMGDADGDEEVDGDSPPGECAELLLSDETFEVAPDLPDTQLHSHAIYDGEALWVTFCLPEEGGTGYFDIWAVRLGCDGAALTPPFRVNTTTAPNDIDPAITHSGDRVMIAWQADTGASPANMQVFYRVFEQDGSPFWDEDRLLVTSRDGEEVVGNVMFPQVLALPDGAFAITAIRGLEESGTFQVFFQRFTSAGELDGEALDGYFEAGVTQTYPTAVATPDGEVYLAWARDDGEGERVVFKMLDDGTTEPEQIAPGTAASGGPRLALASDDPHRPLLAYHMEAGTDLQVYVTMLGGSGSPPELELGEARRLDHTANVAAGLGGGAVAWFRTVRGIRSEVLVQGFGIDGASIVADTELLMDTEDAGSPYHSGFTHIYDDVYFVSWASGTSPDFRIFGRFVTVR